MLHLQKKNFAHADTVGFNTFIEWKSAGSQKTSKYCDTINNENMLVATSMVM
jgi:hypothetical protein